MKRFLSLMLSVVALAAGALILFPSVDSASAAPAGAATNLKVTSVSCTANLATYRLAWTPSGKGAQRVDLSATNNGFANNFSSANLSTTASTVDLTSLKPGTTYYARIVTTISGSAVASDTVSVKAACETNPAFSVPTGLKSSQSGKGTIRFQWTPGHGNDRFCLDTATNAADIVNLKGTWRNHGCGMTGSSIDVSNLPCNTVIYWRVFAWGTSSGHSQVAVTNLPCVIGKPTNLNAQPSGTAGAVLSWSAGAENRWFCVDIAKSPSDLASLSGSWRNYGCWMTGTSISLSNLECGATYYWNVYAWNENTNARSADSSFQVTNCSKTVEADIQDVDVVKTGSRYYAEIVAVVPNACHEPAEYTVKRNGTTFDITVTYETHPGSCQYFAGTYNLSVRLDGDLQSGKTYRVIVNDDRSEKFTVD